MISLNASTPLLRMVAMSSSVTWARVAASVLTELVVTDSIYREGLSEGGKIRRLTIAPLFGEAIHRIADESSVSSLFD